VEGGEPVTFLQIVNSVLSDRFDESLREDAKNWVNHRLGWIWDLEPWTFRDGTANVTVTAGSQAVTNAPTDLGPIRAMLRSDGTRLRALQPDEFFSSYYNNTAISTAQPEAYTVVNGSIFVGPTSSETKTDYRLVYVKRVTLLSADATSPGCRRSSTSRSSTVAPPKA
jgi:hypothetical protein